MVPLNGSPSHVLNSISSTCLIGPLFSMHLLGIVQSLLGFGYLDMSWLGSTRSDWSSTMVLWLELELLLEFWPDMSSISNSLDSALLLIPVCCEAELPDKFFFSWGPPGVRFFKNALGRAVCNSFIHLSLRGLVCKKILPVQNYRKWRNSTLEVQDHQKPKLSGMVSSRKEFSNDS